MFGPAIIWIACAGVIVTQAIRCRRHRRALHTARLAFAVLYIVGGAAANTLFLLRGDDYAKFADASAVPFVRHTWHTLVVPNHAAWIMLLILFELAVGLLALLGGRETQFAYVAAIAFHVALLSFGWGFLLWSLPMITSLAVLLSAERRAVSVTPPPRARTFAPSR